MVVAAWLWLLGSRPGMAAPAAPSRPDAVELDWDTYQMLRGEYDPPTPQAAAPHAASRTVTITPRGQGKPPGFEISARWQLRAERPGFFTGLLAGPNAEVERAALDGIAAPSIRTPLGTVFVAYLTRDATLSLDAFVPAAVDDNGGSLTTTLLPAVRGTVALAGTTSLRLHAAAGDDKPSTPSQGGTLWTGAEALDVVVRKPAASERVEGPLSIARAGIGLTVGEAEVKARVRLSWTMRRGSIEQAEVAIDGLSEDLEVEGRQVSRFSRSANVLTIYFTEPVSTRAEAELRFSTPLRDTAEATFAVPRVQPRASFRSEASLQLARDGEIEVIPQLRGWNAVTAEALPAWGQGLVEGTPTAAYHRGTTAGNSGALSLLRFVPVAGPAVVVDVAAYTMALTEEGRLITLAKYQVRNERAAFLRIKAPKGATIVGARIAGKTAIPGRSKDGTWLVPLKRSLETVDGLLSFPVEVTVLGDGTPWRRRERRTITLPRLDAPIAVSRVTTYLPPGYHSKHEPGDATVVDAFTEGEGITYGLGLGDEETARADSLLQQAVDDYRNNDFEAAQQKLDTLGGIGASNKNTERLQANLDLVTGNSSGEDDAKRDTALARRVREQAKVRATDDFQRWKTLEEQAEAELRAGDYDAAERSYQQALELGDKLEKLEQTESVEAEERNVQLASKLGSVVAKRAAKSKRGTKARRRSRFGSRRRRAEQRAKSDRAPIRANETINDDPNDDPSDDPNDDPADGPALGELSRLEELDGDDGVAVYDFADDEVLTAEDQRALERVLNPGAREADGQRPTPTTQPAAPVAGKPSRWDAPPPKSGRWDAKPEPTAAPEPEPEPGEAIADAVAAAPVITRDESAAISLAGTTGSEATYTVEGVSLRGRAGRGRRRSGRGKRSTKTVAVVRTSRGRPGRRRRRARSFRIPAGSAAPAPTSSSGAAAPPPPKKPAAAPASDDADDLDDADDAEPPPEPSPEAARPLPDAPAQGGGFRARGRRRAEKKKSKDQAAESAPNLEPANAKEIERLPAPKVTASAVSVVIPAIGEEVLYQRLLIEAGQAQTISINARRRRRR